MRGRLGPAQFESQPPVGIGRPDAHAGPIAVALGPNHAVRVPVPQFRSLAVLAEADLDREPGLGHSQRASLQRFAIQAYGLLPRSAAGDNSSGVFPA